eukprot:7850011-Alexandrium_andersonii.AAC.1
MSVQGSGRPRPWRGRPRPRRHERLKPESTRPRPCAEPVHVSTGLGRPRPSPCDFLKLEPSRPCP